MRVNVLQIYKNNGKDAESDALVIFSQPRKDAKDAEEAQREERKGREEITFPPFTSLRYLCVLCAFASKI